MNAHRTGFLYVIWYGLRRGVELRIVGCMGMDSFHPYEEDGKTIMCKSSNLELGGVFFG